MNHREPPLSPAAIAAGKLGLLLGLLLASVPTESHAQPRTVAITLVNLQPETLPYLPVTGAPPLRFQAATPPLHPAPAAPAPVAPPPAASEEASPAPRPDPTADPLANPDPSPAATGAPANSGSTPAAAEPVKTPASILPDDTRPTIRPEDFLPYFQIPGSARTPVGVNVIVPAPQAPPAPGPLPPSSATYTQSPQ